MGSANGLNSIDEAAIVLQAHLHARRIRVDRNALRSILNTCFFASLQQEEQRPIVAAFAYVNPEKPDPDPPLRICPQRWTFHKLASQFDLTIRDLIKLAPAASPSSTLIAIYAHGETPYIWGLVDQQAFYKSVYDRENIGHFRRPGAFQVEISGPGIVKIYDDMHHIVTIREDTLVKKYHDVLSDGPIAEILTRYIEASYRSSRCKLRNLLAGPGLTRDIPTARLKWLTRTIWNGTLSALLLRIRHQKHGGAVLIVPDHRMGGLKPKYRLHYDRLELLISNTIADEMRERTVRGVLRNRHITKGAIQVPTELYLANVHAHVNMADNAEAKKSAVAFVASLAEVDGLLLLSAGLNVTAFGVEITRRKDPTLILVAGDAAGTKTEKVDIREFGMRHRSMMRYCGWQSDAVGFVVSQDGQVRAMTSIAGSLVMWPDVLLQGMLG